MIKIETKTALSLGAIVLALVLALTFRKRDTIIYQSEGLGNVTFGGVQMGEIKVDVPRRDFVMPTFALPPDQFSMISGCCSDCGSKAETVGYAPASDGVTLVFNEGNSGGSVFNYYETAETAQSPYNSFGLAPGFYTGTDGKTYQWGG